MKKIYFIYAEQIKKIKRKETFLKFYTNFKFRIWREVNFLILLFDVISLMFKNDF